MKIKTKKKLKIPFILSIIALIISLLYGCFYLNIKKGLNFYNNFFIAFIGSLMFGLYVFFVFFILIALFKKVQKWGKDFDVKKKKEWNYLIYLLGWLMGIGSIFFWIVMFLAHMCYNYGKRFFNKDLHRRVYLWGIIGIIFIVVVWATVIPLLILENDYISQEQKIDEIIKEEYIKKTFDVTPEFFNAYSYEIPRGNYKIEILTSGEPPSFYILNSSEYDAFDRGEISYYEWCSQRKVQILNCIFSNEKDRKVYFVFLNEGDGRISNINFKLTPFGDFYDYREKYKEEIEENIENDWFDFSLEQQYNKGFILEKQENQEYITVQIKATEPVSVYVLKEGYSFYDFINRIALSFDYYYNNVLDDTFVLDVKEGQVLIISAESTKSDSVDVSIKID